MKTVALYVDTRIDADRIFREFRRILRDKYFSIFDHCKFTEYTIIYRNDLVKLILAPYKPAWVGLGIWKTYELYSPDDSEIVKAVKWFVNITGDLECQDIIDVMHYHTEFEGKRVKDMTIKEALNSWYGTGKYGFIDTDTAPRYKTFTYIPLSMQISKVIYQNPATIVFWKDGSKTVVKCQEDDEYSYAAGVMHAIIRKMYGNSTKKYSDILKWISTAEEYDKACDEAEKEN